MAASINAGNKGLINLGNTCYMNSVIQCLSHLLIFHPQNENFFKECKKLDEGLMYKWFQFQRKMWSNENRDPLNPINLLKTFQESCNQNNFYFENFDQNDVDEFLTIFLELLHKDIKRSVTFRLKSKTDENKSSKIIKNGFNVWKKFYEKDYSYIVENFYSQLLILNICPECYYFTTNHDPIQVISLEIPENAESIYDCFDKYTQKEILDKNNQWTCDNCKEKVCSHKKTMLFRSSDILVILLKRYTSNLMKNNKFIKYPINLQMEKYNKNYGVNKSNVYTLNSFCIHNGFLGGGHYYAVAKNNLDQNWYEYNDSSVNIINTSKILEYIPYLFFYKRI